MRTSLTVSASLHLIVLAIIVLNFNWSAKRSAAPSQPVAVEIIAPSDISRTKAGNPDKPLTEAEPVTAKPKPEEKKAETPSAAPEHKPAEKPAEQPAKKQAALPPPPKPQPARASPAPIPAKLYTQNAQNQGNPAPNQGTPAPQEQTPPETGPSPIAAPLPQKRPDARPERPRDIDAAIRRPPPRAPARDRDDPRDNPRDAPPERDRIANLLDQPPPETSRRTRFDPKRIAALLNRDPDAMPDTPPPERPREPWRRPSSFEDQANGMMAPPRERERERERESYGQPTGRDDRMSANEVDAFIAQVSRCWTPPVGGLGADAIVVKLHIELREDGRLARAPQVANSGGSPFFTPAADSAVRAVLQCEPYRMPPEKYSHWRDMLLNFDPRQMYGG